MLAGSDESSISSNDIQAVIRLVGFNLNPFTATQEDTLQLELFDNLQVSTQVAGLSSPQFVESRVRLRFVVSAEFDRGAGSGHMNSPCPVYAPILLQGPIGWL